MTDARGGATSGAAATRAEARRPAGSPPTNKQQSVYRVLHERISSGAYGPGYRLVIDRLAAELGVSALPVREAIRRLEAEGLVIYQPNAGPRVAPVDPTRYVEGLTALAVLEGYATALAAPHLDGAVIRRLKEIDEEMLACMETMDGLRFGALNHEFHHTITARCGNAYLVGLLEETSERLDMIRRTVFTQIPYRGRQSLEEHRRLIELLASGARARAVEDAARAHKLRTVETFRAWLAEHEQA